MLDVEATVSVQPSKLVRTRNVSTPVLSDIAQPPRTVRSPTIELNVLTFPDVNAWATMTAREVTNAKTASVSRSHSLIPLCHVILMMTSAVNNVPRTLTVLRISTVTDSRGSVFLYVQDSVETTLSVTLPTTTPSAAASLATRAMLMLAVPLSQLLSTPVTPHHVEWRLYVSWTMAIPSAPVPEARLATHL